MAATEQEIQELLNVSEQTMLAIGFADTVVMEFDSTPIEGTRYRYIATNAPDPRER